MKIPGFRRAAQERTLSETETEQVLAMVEAAARIVAPEEYEAAFEEYARLLRSTRMAPGTARGRSDKSAAGIAETAIFLGVGLGILGQIATHVLLTAEDMAIKTGLTNAVAYLRKLRRDKDEAAISAVAAQIVATVEVHAADPSVITRVVRLQIEMLGALPGEPQPGDSSQ
jgi:hypothetical protein